jgi:glutaredoxin
MNITIFSSSTCKPCQQLKYYLKLKGVEYTERSIDNEPSLKEEMIGLVGYALFPTIKIERGDDVKVIAGYNLGALSKELVN